MGWVIGIILFCGAVLASAVWITLKVKDYLQIPPYEEMLEEYIQLTLFLEKATKHGFIHSVNAQRQLTTFLEADKREAWKLLKAAKIRVENIQRKELTRATVKDLLIKHDPERMASEIARLEAEVAGLKQETPEIQYGDNEDTPLKISKDLIRAVRKKYGLQRVQ